MCKKISERCVLRVEGSMPAIHAYLSGWLIALAELLGFTPTDSVWNV